MKLYIGGQIEDSLDTLDLFIEFQRDICYLASKIQFITNCNSKKFEFADNSNVNFAVNLHVGYLYNVGSVVINAYVFDQLMSRRLKRYHSMRINTICLNLAYRWLAPQ